MDWGVHRVCADGTLEKLMDAGGRGDCGRGRSGDTMGLGGVEVLNGSLLLVHPIDRRHAFDAFRIHASYREGFQARWLNRSPRLSFLRSRSGRRRKPSGEEDEEVPYFLGYLRIDGVSLGLAYCEVTGSLTCTVIGGRVGSSLDFT